MNGKLDIVKFLVNECHCDPKLEDRNGNTPLHFACCKKGSIDILSGFSLLTIIVIQYVNGGIELH